MEERRLPPHLRRTQQQQPITREPEQPVQQAPVQQRQVNAYQQPQNENHQQQYNAQQQYVGQQQYPKQQQYQPQQNFNPQQVEQQRKSSKIDVDQIPRPYIKSEESIMCQQFSTAPAPLYHPPQVHQFYQTFDEGNCGPRYMRSSVYAIGNEPSILQQTEIPFGIVVQPLMEPSVFESEIPQVEFTNEPLRCQRCKAYVSPFFQFGEGGNTYICNICKMKNQVPPDYYCVLGQGNQRGDKYQRDELNKGCYEIIAPNSYIKKEIKNTLILFCIELTQISVAKGIYSQVISSLQSILDTIPYPNKTDIAFITFDSKILFYNLPKNLTGEPQIIVVSEIDEANVPLPPEKLFLNIENDRDKIDYMLEKLGKFGETITQQTNQLVSVGTVLSNAVQLMQPRSGRILYFGCSAPRYGIGKIPQKPTDTKLFGTDQEKLFYQPTDQAYVKLGQTCLRNHISVDLFIANDENFELATVSPVSNITGGSIYFYPHYNQQINGTELHYSLYRNLTRAYAYDLIMTVRTSPGIILFDYYTGSGKISVRDLELSSLNSDQSIAIMLKQEEKILDPEAHIQYALLYTNQQGQRVIRVFNLQLQVVNKNSGNNAWHNIFKTGDVDCLATLLCRKYLPNIMVQQIKQIRQNLFESLVSILHAYRKYCSSNSPAGQLILPEPIKILPLYLQSLYKRDLLKQGNVRIDNRIFEIHLVLTQSMHFLNNFFYPKLFSIHDINSQLVSDKYQVGSITDEEKIVLPHNIATTIDKIKSDGIYILDTSQFIYIYVGQNVDQSLLQNLFGVNSFAELNSIEQFTKINTDYSSKVQNIIESLQQIRGGTYVPVRVIRQNSPQATLVQSKLVEDEQQLEKSYADYLCELHGAIQNKGGL
ncbi:unnamed protein product [Paramecium sonneborni]|uniref:Uncharacterized protein n=1 Tax=Paramecium sonneborni TaxID=65129 RepID=A0A8S1KLS7_9CILI|nr:unnamed protein product [Paramecium sonneborni]